MCTRRVYYFLVCPGITFIVFWLFAHICCQLDEDLFSPFAGVFLSWARWALRATVPCSIIITLFAHCHLIDWYNGFYRLFISLLQQWINTTSLHAWLNWLPGICSRAHWFVFVNSHNVPQHTWTVTERTDWLITCYWLVRKWFREITER